MILNNGGLAKYKWPFSISTLPDGTAVVGGSIRDALLNKFQEKPDLDFIVPKYTFFRFGRARF